MGMCAVVNSKLNLVSVDVHIKYGQILFIWSQDIERKQNSDAIKGRNSVKILRKMMNNNLKLINVDVYTKFV